MVQNIGHISIPNPAGSATKLVVWPTNHLRKLSLMTSLLTMLTSWSPRRTSSPSQFLRKVHATVGSCPTESKSMALWLIRTLATASNTPEISSLLNMAQHHPLSNIDHEKANDGSLPRLLLNTPPFTHFLVLYHSVGTRCHHLSSCQLVNTWAPHPQSSLETSSNFRLFSYIPELLLISKTTQETRWAQLSRAYPWFFK